VERVGGVVREREREDNVRWGHAVQRRCGLVRFQCLSPLQAS
jgi:hypothetical protein